MEFIVEDDEAFEIAHRLAATRGVTIDQVLLTALRREYAQMMAERGVRRRRFCNRRSAVGRFTT